MANWAKPSARDPWKGRVASGVQQFGHCGLERSPAKVPGALSFVLGLGSSSLSVSREVWCRSSD